MPCNAHGQQALRPTAQQGAGYPLTCKANLGSRHFNTPRRWWATDRRRCRLRTLRLCGVSAPILHYNQTRKQFRHSTGVYYTIHCLPQRLSRATKACIRLTTPALRRQGTAELVNCIMYTSNMHVKGVGARVRTPAAKAPHAQRAVAHRRRPLVVTRAAGGEQQTTVAETPQQGEGQKQPEQQEQQQQRGKPKRQVESTDAISSFLTRCARGRAPPHLRGPAPERRCLRPTFCAALSCARHARGRRAHGTCNRGRRAPLRPPNVASTAHPPAGTRARATTRARTAPGRRAAQALWHHRRPGLAGLPGGGHPGGAGEDAPGGGGREGWHARRAGHGEGAGGWRPVASGRGARGALGGPTGTPCGAVRAGAAARSGWRGAGGRARVHAAQPHDRALRRRPSAGLARAAPRRPPPEPPPAPPAPAAAQEVVLPSGVRYTDERLGGGQAPSKGMLVVVQYVGTADGAVFEDTRARGKPIVYLYGGRPFTAGLCAGGPRAGRSAGPRARARVLRGRGVCGRVRALRPVALARVVLRWLGERWHARSASTPSGIPYARTNPHTPARTYSRTIARTPPVCRTSGEGRTPARCPLPSAPAASRRRARHPSPFPPRRRGRRRGGGAGDHESGRAAPRGGAAGAGLWRPGCGAAADRARARQAGRHPAGCHPGV